MEDATITQLKAQLRAKKKEPRRFAYYLSTGSTLLNLQCSGNPDVGLLPGHYYLFVGDSQAGKTFLSLMCLAEASINPKFKSYRLIHDNPERGALMNLADFFGPALAKRLEPPSERGSSKTLEEFYYNVDDAVQAGTPFIYLLDSEDALFPEADRKRLREQKRMARRIRDGTEEKAKGSYNTDKARLNSSHLRMAHNALPETGSILIIIKQSRDNIGYDAMFNPKTRSGGRSLTFYATYEFWFSIRGKIKKAVRGKDRMVGSILRVKIKKNRVGGGLDRHADLPFYPSYGFDDIGACVDWLVEEAYWPVSKKKITATEFEQVRSRDSLIEWIEGNNKEAELKQITTRLWQEIDAASKTTRKARYGQ